MYHNMIHKLYFTFNHVTHRIQKKRVKHLQSDYFKLVNLLLLFYKISLLYNIVLPFDNRKLSTPVNSSPIF